MGSRDRELFEVTKVTEEDGSIKFECVMKMTEFIKFFDDTYNFKSMVEEQFAKRIVATTPI